MFATGDPGFKGLYFLKINPRPIFATSQLEWVFFRLSMKGKFDIFYLDKNEISFDIDFFRLRKVSPSL